MTTELNGHGPSHSSARNPSLDSGVMRDAKYGAFRDFYNHWFPIALAKDVQRERPHRVKRLSIPLVLWRAEDGAIRGGSDHCPHRGASLSNGCVRQGTLECPYHGFRFASNGQCIEIPAEGTAAQIPRALFMDMVSLREEHGLIWLWFGERRSEYPAIPFFDGPTAHRHASASTSYACPFDFDRVTENTLDLAHFPVVHRRSFGLPGKRVKVHGWTGTPERFGLEFSYQNEATGKRQASPFFLEFQFPGTAAMNVLPRALYVIGQAPIDAEQTWFFSFVHQRYCTFPLLGEWLCWLILLFEKLFVLPSDYAVMRSQARRDQVPREVHLPSDLPITLWYQHRHKLRQAQREAAQREAAQRETAQRETAQRETAQHPHVDQPVANAPWKRASSGSFE